MKALFEVARKELEAYTSNSLTEKTRRRSINSPLYMRVAFYNTFNEHYNIKGITITKYLGLDHTTCIHYKNIREIILFNDDEYQEQYFKMCDIIKKAVTDYKLSNFNMNSIYAKKVCNDYDTYLDESAELGLHPISIKDYIIKYA